MRTCKVEDCGRVIAPTKGGQGMCPMHYTRFRRYGTTDGMYPQGDALDRLMLRVTKIPDGCWLVSGISRKDGYGAVATGGRGSPKVLAHRLVYERLVGPIPEGFEIHHRCEVRACCNPSHLEAISGTEHRRGHAARRRAA